MPDARLERTRRLYADLNDDHDVCLAQMNARLEQAFREQLARRQTNLVTVTVPSRWFASPVDDLD